MAGKLLIRVLGVFACMAVVVTGFDAEAGWRRHHRRDACYTTPCCETTCCEPVCVTESAACCRTCVADCCGGCTIVSRSVILAAPACCGVAATPVGAPAVAAAPSSAGSTSVLAAKPAPMPAR